jgi:hypothetical protein
LLLLLFVAAATMQYPTTSATRNPWQPVVQPRCDLGRPYQDRVVRKRNLGRPLPLPQQTHHRHLSLSLSLSVLFFSLPCLQCVWFSFFFFLKMIFNPIFETACLWNLLPKRTPPNINKFPWAVKCRVMPTGANRGHYQNKRAYARRSQGRPHSSNAHSWGQYTTKIK